MKRPAQPLTSMIFNNVICMYIFIQVQKEKNVNLALVSFYWNEQKCFDVAVKKQTVASVHSVNIGNIEVLFFIFLLYLFLVCPSLSCLYLKASLKSSHSFSKVGVHSWVKLDRTNHQRRSVLLPFSPYFLFSPICVSLT